MATKDSDHSTSVFCDPQWVQYNGGWLHGNNILFYFAQSPFFDRLSTNNTVYFQSAGIREREEKYLANRKLFETELQNHRGVQYVVVVDPLESKVMVNGPDGQEPSDMWVIRKQNRLQTGLDSEVQHLEYYYVINNVIYQAPRLESILNYRMMNTIKAADNIAETASKLAHFSASYGHTYFRPGQKTTTTTSAVDGQQSKVGTPMPEASGTVAQDQHASVETTAQSDERTLRAALRLTAQYGTQHYDDAPLLGEPGNFRYAKPKDPVQNLRTAESGNIARSTPPSKAGTPAPSQTSKVHSHPASPNSMRNTDEVAEATKTKPKRKKSMATSG